MWIAKIALQRPYTFGALALLILLLGVFTTLGIPIDIFPSINIPVAAAIWSYTGLSPDDMPNRIVLLTEKTAQTDISNVEHTESRSLNGIAVAKHVVAPFDGVVTSRNTDIGALINAAQGSAQFRVADTTKLRVYVLVPQLYAANTTPGLDADLTFLEGPGKKYSAQVVRTADALDPASRMLQMQLLVDNSSGEIFPGAYAQVHFKLLRGARSLSVPGSAVLFRSTDLQVAVVGADNRVTLKSITTGRDFGTSLEVVTGLGPAEDIIASPSDSLATGALVRVLQPPSNPPRPAPGSAGRGTAVMKPKLFLFALAVVATVSACSLAPTYRTPVTPPPAASYKEAGDWKP
ncbi:MAG TPA: efflux RND transporter permease subunit, partial [Steroidobacteraceae bacterium]|nr:efflux RND transporter permease subunit [Steroidobacteraceae bacterium]